MKNKKQAFTLAEVLLVLAIIGVIAAVTIPAIMQQSSEKKFSALAKKAHSTLQNAINLKIATMPIGPGDLGVGLLQWLLDGEDDGSNTLKSIRRDNETDTITMQTPDGMVYWLHQGAGCGTESTRTNLIGCTARIFVDLNGSEGPTKTTIENASVELWDSRSEATAYDTVVFFIETNAKVRTSRNYNTIQTRTIRYLGIPD